MHLTRAYRYTCDIPELDDSEFSRGPHVAITACDLEDVDQVSIYHRPEDEPLIDCPQCLEWLHDGDNRLMVTKGGMGQWLRNHMAAGDRDIRYIDIAMEGDDPE